MTENEKAARLMGWSPNKCPYCEHLLEEQHEGYIGCTVEDCEACVDYYPTNPVPDMSDPRNYMKALDTLRARAFSFVLELDPHYCACFLKTEIVNPKDGHGGEPLHVAIIRTLAALYDAEHPAESR